MKHFIPHDHEKCGGKNCYNSQTEADIVAREQEILHMTDELQLRSYRCIACAKWHLSRVKTADET